MSFKAKPRSIKDIREKAELIRTVTVMAMDTKTEQFPILHFAEIIIPQIAEDFTFVIGSKEEMGNNLGLTDIKEKTITIREDVYENAYNGNGRDLFTIAHEVGHVLLHSEQNIQQLARTNKETIKPYENPEWQADTFAAELLMPASMITEDDTVFTVARRFGVSYSAARIRLNKLGIINALNMYIPYSFPNKNIAKRSVYVYNINRMFNYIRPNRQVWFVFCKSLSPNRLFLF